MPVIFSDKIKNSAKRRSFKGRLFILSLFAGLSLRADPVFLELFTSQGCSSCPAAEEILSGWGKGAFKRGEVIPLAFHVDYWDYIGWTDPFSSKDFAQRQRNYAKKWGESAIYTPQMVVDGKIGFSGADFMRLKDEIARRSGKAPRGQLKLECRLSGGNLKVLFSASELEAGRLYLALFENDLQTEVDKGENWGRSLQGDFIVRSFGSVDVPIEGRAQERNVPVKEEWKPKNMGAVLFYQDASSLEIVASTAAFPLK